MLLSTQAVTVAPKLCNLGRFVTIYRLPSVMHIAFNTGRKNRDCRTIFFSVFSIG